jgi:hypothetical protein
MYCRHPVSLQKSLYSHADASRLTAGAEEMDQSEDRIWGLLPRERSISLQHVGKLRSSEHALSYGVHSAIIEANPWAGALCRLGCEIRVDPRVLPIEEGETSLNANAPQALASLLVLERAQTAGISVTVLGTMAGGNHSLLHSLQRLSMSFPNPRRALFLLREVFGTCALESVERSLPDVRLQVRKAFTNLPPHIRRERALRLPPIRVPAPSPDALRTLAGRLGFGRAVSTACTEVRDVMEERGLSTVADLILLLRSLSIHRMAQRIGIGPVNLIPVLLEYLLLHGTGGAVGALAVGELAQQYREALARLPEISVRGEVIRSGRFRCLNYYRLEHLLLAGRQERMLGDDGWSVLRDRYAGEELSPANEEHRVREMSVGEALSSGFGLSGKLTYVALTTVNRGAVCNLVFREPEHVYASLADPLHPGLIFPLGQVGIFGEWQVPPRVGPLPTLDISVVLDRIEQSRRGGFAIRSLLRRFAELARDPENPSGTQDLVFSGAWSPLQHNFRYG